jgi:hypothetical protein
MGAQVPTLETSAEVREDGRDRTHFGNGVELDVAEVRIREGDGTGESTKDDVAELYAAGGYRITQGEVVFAQEFGKVVEEYKKESEGSAIQVTRGKLEVCVHQKWGQKLEEGQ